MRGRQRSLGLPAVLAVVLAVGCYSYHPLITATPAPGTPVSLVLNDVGRVGVAESIGPGTARVQGTVVRATETAYVVSISDVLGLDGRRSRWAGETVGVQKSYVAVPYERRFSRKRTIVLVSTMVAGVGTLLLSWNLLGLGGPLFGGGGGDGGQQQ